ncbi:MULTISPECIES: winged helix DNA-binding domain-containing protein [unclassified Microbacterium]|uniref:winged helix DNA-binding domain-containing protein n=1 Tax=unclassified Microbacterium TaxID=2609290 RepID=UPI0012FB036D
MTRNRPAGGTGARTLRDIAHWRLRSQLLEAPMADAESVVRTMLAVQAENPAQSAWAVATRTASPDRDDLAQSLAAGRIVRTHVLRPTWHYVHADDARWLIELTAPRVLPVFDQQLRPVADRMTELADAIAEAVAGGTGLTRPEIASALADRGLGLPSQQLTLLLGRLELHLLLSSGVPRDGQHTYALMDERVPASSTIDRDEALARLAFRYLGSHGPATDRDLAYWATLTLTDARRGIAAVSEQLEFFEHDERTYWHAPASVPAPTPARAHLLQILDEMYRGYQDSRWTLDAEGIVPRGRETSTGMVLCDGQLVAGMRRTVDARRVLFEVAPYRRLTKRELAEIQKAAGRSAAYLGVEAALEVADV